MHLNLIYFILIGMMAVLFWNKDSSENRKKFILLSSLILILGPTLRSVHYGIEVGLDTLEYYNFFHRNGDNSFSEIWDLAKARYLGVGEEEADIGYMMLCKIIGQVTDNFHTYTFIALLIFFVPYGIFLYRHVETISGLFLSFVFYIVLVSTFAMGGARQLFAVGMSILGLLFYEERKYKSAAISFVIGLTIHFSMILIILPLILSRIAPQYQKKIHLVSLLLFPVVWLMPNLIIQFMGGLVGSEKYAAYGQEEAQGGATTFILLIEILSIFCYIGIKKMSIGSKVPTLWYTMLPCMTMFAPLISSNGTMIRITLYFYLYLTMLLPYAIKTFFPAQEKSYVGFITIILMLLNLKNSWIPYYFFWMVDPVSLWN